MWLAKPVYELLPYVYVVIGAAAIVVAVFVQTWYWPMIWAAVGFVGIVTGIALLLKRRGYRSSRSRMDFDGTS